MKRFFHILLSIYIIALTIMPCVDEVHGVSCSETEVCSTTPGQEHQDLDQCSPFCDCNCCGISMITVISHFNIEIHAIAVEKLAFYHRDLPVNYYSLPWHPPKQA